MKLFSVTKITPALTLTFTLLAGSSLALAADISLNEAIKLRDAGTILTFDRLDALALEQHPGSTIRETELELELGRYIYKVELMDANIIEWDIEMDATNGAILKTRQDK